MFMEYFEKSKDWGNANLAGDRVLESFLKKILLNLS